MKESLSSENDSIEGQHLAAGSSFSNIGEKNNLLSLKESLALKYLREADANVSESNLILSLFDFGGQSVFNIIHHLFMTSYGVYVLVFTMVDILDDNKREQSLSEISFWINSIVMHTCDKMSGKVAPIFLVGTHKDYVNDAANFDRISQIIEDRFRYNPGWPYIMDNSNGLCFFPVNNVLGQGDEKIVDLMTKIVEVATEADYVKAPRPLTWLKALDELMATNRSFLTMTEASSIAIASGVEEDAVPFFLSFLNEMSVVLWLNREGLRDVVILDIITFFVEPATLIICNHIANRSDSTVHQKKIQEICKRKRAVEWDEMTQRGLLSRPLVELLVHKTGENNIPVIIDIMLFYGLIVRLDRINDITTIVVQPPIYYLVPALLPRTVGNPYTFQDSRWRIIRNFMSCYFFFTLDARMHDAKSYNFSSLRNEGFLPRGVMERLIGKAVQWSQLTNIIDVHEMMRLYQNYAVLSYGRQQFRLICIPEINCIRLDIEGEHPLPVYNRICEQISECVKECMRECMRSLQFITALPLGTASDLSQELSLLNLQALRDIHENDSSLVVNDFPLVNRQYVSSNYGPWLLNTDMLSSYDVFISHRWHKADDELVDQLYDAFLLGFTVCSEKRAVQVFDNKVMLKKAQRFQNVMARVLINSTIFVPLLSSAALQRMLTHNPAEEDNLLIEWMLALECMQNPSQSKVRYIYPLLFGERKEDGSVGVLFYEGIFDRLPDIIPTASIEAVKKLLKENNVNVSSSSNNRTVRDIVGEISKYYGLPGWAYSSNELVDIFTETIVNIINEKYEDTNVRNCNVV